MRSVKVLALSRAADLGRISPKKSKRMELTAVMANPLRYSSRWTARMEEAATMAMLLPTSIVVKNPSGCLMKAVACLAPRTPWRTQTSSLMRLAEIRAVSELEKKADSKRAMTKKT